MAAEYTPFVDMSPDACLAELPHDWYRDWNHMQHNDHAGSLDVPWWFTATTIELEAAEDVAYANKFWLLVQRGQTS